VLDNVVEESSNTIWKNIYTEIKGENKEITLINCVSSSLFLVFGSLDISSFTLIAKGSSIISVVPMGIVKVTDFSIKGLNNKMNFKILILILQ